MKIARKKLFFIPGHTIPAVARVSCEYGFNDDRSMSRRRNRTTRPVQHCSFYVNKQPLWSCILPGGWSLASKYPIIAGRLRSSAVAFVFSESDSRGFVVRGNIKVGGGDITSSWQQRMPCRARVNDIPLHGAINETRIAPSDRNWRARESDHNGRWRSHTHIQRARASVNRCQQCAGTLSWPRPTYRRAAAPSNLGTLLCCIEQERFIVAIFVIIIIIITSAKEVISSSASVSFFVFLLAASRKNHSTGFHKDFGGKRITLR